MIKLNEGQEKAKNELKDRYLKKYPLSILSGKAGSGKGHPIDMVIPTPSGYRAFGDICVGDFVFGSNGYPTQVDAVYKRGMIECYRVEFTDGVATMCDKDHLWTFIDKKGVSHTKNILKIKEMSKKERSDLLFPTLTSSTLPRGLNKVEVDHFVFGAICGFSMDVSAVLDDAVLCMHLGKSAGLEEFDRNSIKNLLSDSFSSGFDYEQQVKDIEFSTISERTSFLAGFVHVYENRPISLEPDIAKTIYHIFLSLGVPCKIEKSGMVGRLTISFIDIPDGKQWYRTISKIVAIGPRQVNCISVSAPDSLYAVNDYIITHNTAMVNVLIDELGLDPNDEVLFATYTGKAAQVLNKKGIPAKTIHKSFYSTRAFSFEDKKTKEMKTFFDHSMLPKDDLEWCKLIVLDEASMIPKDLLNDIMKYEIPIFLIGDDGQLESTGEPEAYCATLLEKPDARLTQIMRQSEDSRILEVADIFRQEQNPGYGDFGSDCRVIPASEVHIGYATWADQVIVSTNKQRKEWNDAIRADLGYSGMYPKPGEKIICLKNDWTCLSSTGQSLINGLIGVVKEFNATRSPDTYEMIVIDDFDGGEFHVIGKKNTFNPKAPFPKKDSGVQDFDFGYAITIHKSQGSEYEKVFALVGGKNHYETKKQYARKAYTAATRASSKLIIAI